MDVLSQKFRVWPVFVAVAVALVFMLVAAGLYWPRPLAAFGSDGSPVAWLSSAGLWTLAWVALRLDIERLLPRALARWLFVAMLALAFDEQFMLHERWKFGCAEWFDACQHRWVTEAPTLVLGIVGLATASWLHRALASPQARVLLWLALACGFLGLAVDLFGWPPALVAVEEGIEVVAESLYLGLLLGLTGGAPRAAQVHS